MIYVTGDFHGNVRELLSRFDKLQTGEGDIIVVLGDAGLNYYGNHHGDLKSKKSLARSGTEYFCIHGKVLFDGLEYESFNGWKTVGTMLWGYPHMLEYEAPLIYNRLMIEDATFASLSEAMTNLELSEPDFNFSGFCDDIFGDG